MNKFLTTAACCILTVCSIHSLRAQEAPAGVSILSGPKEIFRETDMLKQVADDAYLPKIDLLKDKIIAQIKKEVKSLATDQNSREEKITLASTTLVSIMEKNGKPFVRYTIPKNRAEFKVTTPSVAFGLGAGKGFDPWIQATFDVYADIPLLQSGTSESIKFLNPVWDITDLHVFQVGTKGFMFDKTDLDIWARVNLTTALQAVYLSLNEIAGRLNDYLATAVKNNTALQQEFLLDGDHQLLAKADEANKLVFVHSYSKAGIVKRTSTDKAAVAAKEVIAVPPRPGVTKSASKILGSPAAAKPKAKVN